MACSIEDDYETLSFWFDGVPTREELRAEQERAANPDAQDDPNAPVVEPGRRRRDRPSSFPPGFSRHQPYAEKDCEACHESSARSATGFVQGIPTLSMPMGELCVSCHEAEVDTYVHGPSASGACSICHVAHQSAYPSLLRYKNQDALCLDCHTSEYFATRDQHQAYAEQECVACHDPHAAAHPSLLREPQE